MQLNVVLTLSRFTAFAYAPNVFANAFITLLFTSKLALSPNPLLYLVFLSKFAMAAMRHFEFANGFSVIPNSFQNDTITSKL
jgi:hypothetical protein